MGYVYDPQLCCKFDCYDDFEFLADELKHLHEHLEKTSQEQLEVLKKMSEQMEMIIMLMQEKS